MKNKRILILAAMIFSGLIFGGGFASAASLESNIIIQVNQERKKAGLEELAENDALTKAAELKAKDMIGNNYFSHTSPKGVDPWHWLGEVGYEYKYAGENLAMDFTTAEAVHRAWMKSQTHKENIMSDKYTEIGVAVAEGVIENRERKVAVQFFGTPLAAKRTTLSQLETKIFVSDVSIEEASVQPWQGTLEDEMLVYAEVKGEPSSTEVYVGSKHFPLQKMSEGKYMNLVSLSGIDLKIEEVIIKTEAEENKAIFYQIPKQQYYSYLNLKEEKEKSSIAAAAARGNNGRSYQGEIMNIQNVIASGIMLVCAVMVFNVWILEKEEERLLEECGLKA